MGRPRPGESGGKPSPTLAGVGRTIVRRLGEEFEPGFPGPWGGGTQVAQRGQPNRALRGSPAHRAPLAYVTAGQYPYKTGRHPDSLPAPPDGHALYSLGCSPQKIGHVTLGDLNQEAGALAPSIRRASRPFELHGSLRHYASRRPQVRRVAGGRRAVHQSPDGPRDGGLTTTVTLLIAESTANAACVAGCAGMRPASTSAWAGVNCELRSLTPAATGGRRHSTPAVLANRGMDSALSRRSPTTGACARTTPETRWCGPCAASEVRWSSQKRNPNSPPSS